LDLVLAEVCSLQVVKAFFGMAKAIIAFINGSPKRKTISAKELFNQLIMKQNVNILLNYAKHVGLKNNHQLLHLNKFISVLSLPLII